MVNKIRLEGSTYGHLRVIKEDTERGFNSRYRFWVCLCKCGNTVSVRQCHLRTGNTRSCGCIRPIGVRKYKSHPADVYKAWSNMKTRCYNTGFKYYNYYGGRGIKVCDRWLESFENFYEDMGDKPSKDHSLDRIGNDGDYCPENCRWATRKEQARNKSNNRMLTINGVTKTLTEWCSERGLSRGVVAARIDTLGWSVSDALEIQEVVDISWRSF